MPKLKIEPIVRRLKEIDECLRKNNFKKARFLLHDLQLSFTNIDKCLTNWEKLGLAEI